LAATGGIGSNNFGGSGGSCFIASSSDGNLTNPAILGIFTVLFGYALALGIVWIFRNTGKNMVSD
jgi:hypothetical protein